MLLPWRWMVCVCVCVCQSHPPALFSGACRIEMKRAQRKAWSRCRQKFAPFVFTIFFRTASSRTAVFSSSPALLYLRTSAPTPPCPSFPPGLMLKHGGTTHRQLLPQGPSGERDIKVMSSCCRAWGKVQARLNPLLFLPFMP